MKTKTILFAAIAVVFMSCSKEEENNNRGGGGGNNSSCNCGTIANDGITDGCYWLEIRNSCSGNKKSFCFDQDVWMDAHVGENFCVTNQPGW